MGSWEPLFAGRAPPILAALTLYSFKVKILIRRSVFDHTWLVIRLILLVK